MSSESEEKERSWPGEHLLCLDLRSLALCRICVAFLIFCDTLVRWTDVEAHYSDLGVLPRRELLDLGWHEYWFSLHLANGTLTWLNVLFFIQTVLAVLLFVGYRTRLMTFFSWVFLISIHSRNPVVLNGGDIYLRLVLFWMLFLPWGHHWSLDAKQKRGDHSRWMPDIIDKQIKSCASLGLTVQVAVVYWFAAIPKKDPAWTADYSATALALKIDQFVTPLGYFFRDQFAGQLALITFCVIMWEFWGPFLLFFPFDKGQVRTLAVAGFMLMHIGFGSLMELGFFAWIGTLMPLVLLPKWFWERVASKPAQRLDALIPELPVAKTWGVLTLPRETFFLFIVVYCFLWNMQNEDLRPVQFRIPRNLTWFGHALRIDQRWNMFSPGPFREDGWYVIEGRFKTGKTLDLYKNKEISWDKPKNVAKTYKNQRWRKYLMNLWLMENERYRLPYGRYLCRKWNKRGRGSDKLVEFDIFYMLELTNLDGTEEKPEKREIWQHWCHDTPKKVPLSNPNRTKKPLIPEAKSPKNLRPAKLEK